MALRDWLHSEVVATATPATVATKPHSSSQTVANVAKIAVAEPRPNDLPTGNRAAGIFQDRSTETTIVETDTILDHLTIVSTPQTETAIIEAVGGDESAVRGALCRLAVEGIVELVQGGLYRIPDHQAKALYLPENCPLRGGPVPSGCRFEPCFFRRMVKGGVLPYPNGDCPLIRVCKLQTMRPI